MKRIILILTLTVLTIISHTAFADEIISFTTSDVSSTAGTGFRFAETGESKIVMIEEENTALYIKDTVAYNNSWSKEGIDYLVLETRLMAEKLTGSNSIKFRTPQASYWDAFSMNTNSFSSCGKIIEGIEVEAGRWYDIKISLKKNPSYMIDVWIDGVKVASNAFEKISDLPQTGFQVRFEAGDESGLFIGDTRMYIPEKPVSEILNPTLESTDEKVLIKLESSEIDDASIVKESVRVVDNTFNTEPAFELEKTDDGIAIVFTDEIYSDNSYTVYLEAITDISGQGFGECVFNTPLPEVEYITDGAKLYKGYEMSEETSKLDSSAVTVYMPVKNGGIQKRQAAMVCVLYSGGKLSDVSIAQTVLDAMEESEIIASINTEEADEDSFLTVMLWDGFGGRPVRAAEIFKD